MTNVAVLEGETNVIGYSQSKQGLVFSTNTSKGPVRCFLQGTKDQTVPKRISLKGYIRSVEYDGEILEEVFVEMFTELSEAQVAEARQALATPTEGNPEDWDDVPPMGPPPEEVM